jgi:hypothetical protein
MDNRPVRQAWDTHAALEFRGAWSPYLREGVQAATWTPVHGLTEERRRRSVDPVARDRVRSLLGEQGSSPAAVLEHARALADSGLLAALGAELADSALTRQPGQPRPDPHQARVAEEMRLACDRALAEMEGDSRLEKALALYDTAQAVEPRARRRGRALPAAAEVSIGVSSGPRRRRGHIEVGALWPLRDHGERRKMKTRLPVETSPVISEVAARMKSEYELTARSSSSSVPVRIASLSSASIPCCSSDRGPSAAMYTASRRAVVLSQAEFAVGESTPKRSSILPIAETADFRPALKSSVDLICPLRELTIGLADR